MQIFTPMNAKNKEKVEWLKRQRPRREWLQLGRPRRYDECPIAPLGQGRPNPHLEIESFMRAYRITLPSHEDWRLTDLIEGEINGLPGSRGTLTATNGVLCYVIREGFPPFLGHLDFFVSDRGERFDFDSKTSALRTRNKRESHLNSLIADLV